MSIDQFIYESYGFETTLDTSQLSALKQALVHRVATIQGPPGTGKTFIGIKLVKLLLSLDKSPSGPILLLTYKNHALNEFLLGLLNEKITNIIRVGGRAQEESLESYNMNHVKRQKNNRMTKPIFEKWIQLKNEIEFTKSNLRQRFEKLDQSRNMSIHELLRSLTKIQLHKLLSGNKKYNDHQITSMNADKILKLEKEVVRQWSPGMLEVKSVENELKQYLTNKSAFAFESKNPQISNDNDLLDERDVAQTMEERLAATGIRSTESSSEIMKDMFFVNKNKTNDFTLLDGMVEAAKIEPLHILKNIDDLWQLDGKTRVKFIQSKIVENYQQAAELFQENLAHFERLCAEKETLEYEHCGQVAHKAGVVGMTVTGASINQAMLGVAKPGIVIVEEAAEVLEPQLTAILGKWVQHLILIGDHKQLRPPVESFDLQKYFHFDISLMERLIKNDFPFTTLMMQNRMRPEFAKLLLDIYPKLQSNMTRVVNNSAPACCKQAMFFWDHDNEETAARSYTNDEEASRAVQLALFMLKQGHKPNEITILGAYQGQVALIRRKLIAAKQKHPDCFDGRYCETAELTGPNEPSSTKEGRVNVMTIDMYQGDENEIVIVSLVRSNKDKRAGFLKLRNRRCVAQSRAKCGMFIIGNKETIQTTDWKIVIDGMEDVGCVGKTLPLCCPKHQLITTISVINASDIPLKDFCKIPCSTYMPCGIHECPLTCQPPHHHLRCKAKVYFTFPTCKHPGEKKCFQGIDDKVCHLKIRNVQLHCGHRADKLCYQSASEIQCNDICGKPLPCKHLCQNLCCQPCNGPCPECDKLNEIRKEMEKKEQEKLLSAMREDTKTTIAKLREEQKSGSLGDPQACMDDLNPFNDTASEYFSVEDRVKRYIQPDHQWFPHITKIQRITNTSLEIKWLERKLKLNGTQMRSLFHGTAATDAIIKKGFIIPERHNQMYGSGIYFASDSSKSAQTLYTKGSNTLLLCDVLLGKSKTMTEPSPEMTLQNLKSDNYDSVFAKRDSKATGGCKFDEYIVYHKDQALPRYVIYYDTTAIPDILPSVTLNPSTAMCTKKYAITAEREFETDNKLQMHFRFAESQVLRLLQRNASVKLKSVDFYENPPLMQRFNKKSAEFKMKYQGIKEGKMVLAFHGTQKQHIDEIVEHNFSMEKIKRAAYGRGIYFSEFPDISLGYGKSLLLCMVLPGRSFDCVGSMSNASLQAGFDSHRVQKDEDGMGQMLVIFNVDQILPCYVLHLEGLA